MRKRKNTELIPIVLTVVLFVALFAFFYFKEGLSFSFVYQKSLFPGLLINLGIFYVILLVQSTLHEIIHLVVFKLFNPNAKFKISLVSTGIKITPAKLSLSRVEFQIVAIMPFLIFCIPLILYYVFELKNEVFLYLFMLNTSGSGFDFVAFFKAYAYPPQARYPR